jgi:metallo-beta-lactamase family protein
MRLSFFGATGTVTGSKYLLEEGERRTLVDCGLFQGFKQLRLRNWQPLPFDAKAVHAVLLTHAHIDHSGYLPVLVKRGFKKPIYCTRATADLCRIMLTDAAHLQEEEARYANKRGFSRHKPALPLFTGEDAERTLDLLHPVDFDEPVRLGGRTSARFLRSGHILGAAMIMVESGGRRILFSGDLGRPGDPVCRPPETIDAADVVVLESTYGDRKHATADPEAVLGDHLERAIRRRGVVVIPAFAVGRTQTLLLLLARLKAKGRLHGVPVYLNSPMAVDATRIYQAHADEHRLTAEECRAACQVAEFVTTVEESKALNRRHGPMIIIAASGMATGGRVVHHLAAFAPDPNNLILFAGFQAGGTRGASIVGGAPTVRIHGEDVAVRAEVANLDLLSAHADADEILAWLRKFRRPPEMTYLTHGEPAAADQLRQRIERGLGWACTVPDYRETVDV